MRNGLISIISIFAIFFTMPASAKKVALVIGNSNYEYTQQLSNPENDAALIANAARSSKFDDVIVAQNLGVEAFRKTLREFSSKAEDAEVAMIYFAGHGMEGKGKNWLIPIDAKLESDRDLAYETIDLDLLMEALSGAQTRIAIIDACRNNPFGNKWKSGTRAVSRGLAGLEVDDVLVIFAAAPGQTTSDGGEDINSPFAQSLAKRLPQPDVPIQLLGGLVRDDVLAATEGKQRPFVSASITGTPIYLVRENKAIVAPIPNVAPTSTAALAVPRSIGAGPILLSDIQIETKKLTGFFGMPDDLFIEFGTGERFPSGDGKQRMKVGDIWNIEDSFVFDEPVSFRVMEHDAVGGHDLIGTVTMPPTIGTHSTTLNGDKSVYKVTYTLTAM